MLFVSGCKSNQGKFYPQFAQVILLSAAVPVIIECLAARTNNPYGKDPAELARVLGYIQIVEPRLRAGAALEVATNAPLTEIIATVLGQLR